MIGRLEVTAGEGTVIRFGYVTAWAAPTASLSLISFLSESARNLAASPAGGAQLADHLAGVLEQRDPEPHVGFAVVGPSSDGWAALLHGPVQLWDGLRWVVSDPVTGWRRCPLWPQPSVAVGAAGVAVPPLSPDSLYDLEAGIVPGGGFVLIPSVPVHPGSAPDPEATAVIPVGAAPVGAETIGPGTVGTEPIAEGLAGPPADDTGIADPVAAPTVAVEPVAAEPVAAEPAATETLAAEAAATGTASVGSAAVGTAAVGAAALAGAGALAAGTGDRNPADDSSPEDDSLETPQPETPQPGTPQPETPQIEDSSRPEAAGRPPAGVLDLTAGDAGARLVPYPPLPPGGSPAQSVPGSPVVAGVLCPRGHLNRPGMADCARCGRPIPDGAPYNVTGTRPALGCLVIDDGRVVRLDTGYLAGSDPARDPTVRGRLARPLVLAGDDVSPGHAEIRLQDWDVVVTDRASAGGTCVYEPHSTAWERLRPYETRVLRPGTHIAFGQRVVTFVTPWVPATGD